MNLKKQKDIDNNFEAFKKLVSAMRNDPLIYDKIMSILRMNSFKRRAVLNNWLEQLRIRNASEDLLGALSCLFDDKIAEDVLALIKDHKNYWSLCN